MKKKMIEQTINELRELKDAMEKDNWGEHSEIYSINKAIIALNQYKKCRKKLKWLERRATREYF